MVIQDIQGPSPMRFKEKSMTLRRSDLSHSNLHLKIHRVLVLGLVWYRRVWRSQVLVISTLFHWATTSKSRKQHDCGTDKTI
jgi:hypothetical protein